jgi:hypothetical protein
VGNRSNLKAVDKARISHSDDVTSSNALLNQWLRGFWVLSLFSKVTMSRRIAKCGNGGVWDASGGKRVFSNSQLRL